jgi:hypothetical protein
MFAKRLGRFAIDPSTDFSAARSQVEALAKAAPGDKGRLSTTMSVRSTGVDSDKRDKKEKRRESTGGRDGKKAKKAKH